MSVIKTTVDISYGYQDKLWDAVYRLSVLEKRTITVVFIDSGKRKFWRIKY